MQKYAVPIRSSHIIFELKKLFYFVRFQWRALISLFSASHVRISIRRKILKLFLEDKIDK